MLKVRVGSAELRELLVPKLIILPEQFNQKQVLDLTLYICELTALVSQFGQIFSVVRNAGQSKSASNETDVQITVKWDRQFQTEKLIARRLRGPQIRPM